MSTQVMNQLTQIRNNTNRTWFENNQKNLGSDKIDKASFMQLMLAQLQYQDPTNPVDNSQFLQQQSMLAQLDETRAQTESMVLNRAAGLVGQYVEVDTGVFNYKLGRNDTIFGKVDSVAFQSGKAYVTMGEDQYESTDVLAIYSAEAIENQNNQGGG